MNCLHKSALDLADMFISFKMIKCTDCGKTWTRKEWNQDKHYIQETYDYEMDKVREAQEAYNDVLFEHGRGN